VVTGRYVIFGCIAAYSALHAISFGPVTWLVLSEIFPAKIKGKAMGLCTTANRFTSFVAALTFLTMCEQLKWGGTFWVYGGFAAFAFVFYALFVPETTGLPLEEITPKFENTKELVRENWRSLPLVGRNAAKGA
jgi:predicted MFS family arabinose efflux permease